MEQGYYPGGVYVTCDRCAKKARANSTAIEAWTGLRVCRATCLDPRPPYLDPPNVWPEGLPIDNPRPISPIVPVGDVTEDDL